MLFAICKVKDKDSYWFHARDVNDVVDDLVYVADDLIGVTHGKFGRNGAITDSELCLDDNDLFVVAYDGEDYCDNGYVDLGITKQDIIDNVISGKYDNGACYWTFGQMLKTTHDWMCGEVVE